MSGQKINWETHKVQTSYVLPKQSKHRATMEKIQALLDEAGIVLVTDEDGHVCFESVETANLYDYQSLPVLDLSEVVEEVVPRSEEELAERAAVKAKQALIEQQRRARHDEIVMRGVFEWSKIADESERVLSVLGSTKVVKVAVTDEMRKNILSKEKP